MSEVPFRRGELTLAMLALNSNELSSAESFQSALNKVFSRPIKVEAAPESSAFNLETSDGPAFVALMDAPIPWSFLEGPCQTSVFWPAAADRLRNLRDHALVTAHVESGDVIAESMLATRVMAALIDCNDAAGVYWGQAPLVADPAMFCDMASKMTRESLPLYLWIDFRVRRDPDDGFIEAFTSGMSSFGHMEIEFVSDGLTPQDVLGILFDTAHYLLDHGPILRDGNTIEFDKCGTLRIRHDESTLGLGETVLKLSRDVD